MAHQSESTITLNLASIQVNNLKELNTISGNSPDVYFFRFPFPRSIEDANASDAAFKQLANYCENLDSQAVVCVLTTPSDAAMFLPQFEDKLKFQLWIAVKTTPESYEVTENTLPQSHAALLVFSKCRELLRHTKTRVQYTFCPACQKTTKDYGGKKHIFNEYGTLLSDIWRDIECNPSENIDVVINRTRDLFGLEPHQNLNLIDLKNCQELQPTKVTSQSAPKAETNQIKLESQLINDDCLSVLKNIPSDSIDFCFADPPYNIKKKYDKWDDGLDSVEYFDWCDKWLSELYRILKPSRTLAILNIPLWVVRHFQHLNSFAKFQSWIAWDALGYPVRMIMPAHYAIICFTKGESRILPYFTDKSKNLTALKEFYCLRPNCISKRNKTAVTDQETITDLWFDVHRLKHNSRRVDHPCQLPPMLMRRLYSVFTEPDEIILDCFNGAGTSTLVAQQMSRRFIGIELSAQYHEITQKRHEQLSKGNDPFGKVDSVPTVKNSSVERLLKQKYKVSKKELQLDVKRIAQELERLPTKNEVRQMSNFPIEYFENYFVSWGEVCAAARTTGMTENQAEIFQNQPNLF